jgi:hypothetical protein
MIGKTICHYRMVDQAQADSSRITSNPEVIPRTACKVGLSVNSPQAAGQGQGKLPQSVGRVAA